MAILTRQTEELMEENEELSLLDFADVYMQKFKRRLEPPLFEEPSIRSLLDRLNNILLLEPCLSKSSLISKFQQIFRNPEVLLAASVERATRQLFGVEERSASSTSWQRAHVLIYRMRAIAAPLRAHLRFKVRIFALRPEQHVDL
jgi:hypothetical protein